MSNESESKPNCTWCRDRGHITKRSDLRTTSKARWILVITFAGFMLVITAIGRLHGWLALSAIVIILIAFAMQFLIELAEMKNLIFGKTVTFPRCSRAPRYV